MIDLRSDSSAPPTLAMRNAMARAEAGDDFYGESHATRDLEQRVAELLGKPSSLLLPTGTMANATAILAWETSEIFLDAKAHIRIREMDPRGALGHLTPRFSESADGCPVVPDVLAWLKDKPARPLVCVEQTNLWLGGHAIQLPNLMTLRSVAPRIHLDGARLFYAAEVLGLSTRQIAEQADSVMISLVKGLGGPGGAILAGPAAFIEKAREVRQILGGTMRQPAFLAAAASVALDAGFDHLKIDRENAQRLGGAFRAYLATDVATNIVLLDPAKLGVSGPEFLQRARDRGVKLSLLGPTIRAVTHRGVSVAQVTEAIEILRALLPEQSDNTTGRFGNRRAADPLIQK
ncbi:low-specificity L-threonine aldolase [soil metagenome]